MFFLFVFTTFFAVSEKNVKLLYQGLSVAGGSGETQFTLCNSQSEQNPLKRNNAHLDDNEPDKANPPHNDPQVDEGSILNVSTSINDPAAIAVLGDLRRIPAFQVWLLKKFYFKTIV